MTGCDAGTATTDTNIQQDNKEVSMLSLLLGKKPLQNYVLSSPIEGILMKGGKPLANTKIIREINWFEGEEKVFEEFTSNDNGVFSLPVYEKELKLGKLTQFVVNSYLYAHEIDPNDDNLFYTSSNFGGKLYLDTEKGPLINLICELTQPLNGTGLDSPIYSRCTWQGKSES